MTSAPIFYEYETFQLYNLVLVPPIFTFFPWPRLGLSPGLGATLAISGKLSERQLMITSIFDFLASLLRFHTPHTLLRIPYCIPTTLAAFLLQATVLKLLKMHPVPPPPHSSNPDVLSGCEDGGVCCPTLFRFGYSTARHTSPFKKAQKIYRPSAATIAHVPTTVCQFPHTCLVVGYEMFRSI